MKYINKHIKGILGLGLLMVLIFSCADYEDFSSIEQSIASPNVTVAVDAIGDSSATVHATTDKKGYMSLIIFNAADTNTYDAYDLLTNNVAGTDAWTNGSVEENGTLSVTFDLSAHNTEFRALAVANNVNGNVSDVVELKFKTDDSHEPVADFGSLSPGVSDDASQDLEFKVTIPFDEPVVLKDASLIEFGYYDVATDAIVWEALTSDNVTVGANSVTISQESTPAYGQYVYLRIDEGAITDVVGNVWGGIDSGYDASEEEDYGLFWRTEHDVITIDTITPGIGTAVSDSNDFVVTVTFDREIAGLSSDFSSKLDEEKVNIVFGYYYTDGSYKQFPVDGSFITIDGNKVMIEQPEETGPGTKISLEINEGAFIDINENPSEEFEMVIVDDDDDERWLLSYGYEVSLIVGDYIAYCTSYWGGDYEYNITIEEDASVANGVLITGLFNSDSIVNGVFDGVLGKLTIAAGQSLGEWSVGGTPYEFYTEAGYGDFETPIVGSIASNGDLTVSWGALNGDAGWLDFYPGSSWVKQVAPLKIIDNKTQLLPKQVYGSLK